MTKKNIRNIAIIIIAIIALFVLNQVLDSYQGKIANLCGIYIVLALSLNLVNGDTGLFSLGHAGFMAVGAYTLALLTMPTETKEMNYYMQPMVPWLLHLNMPYILAILMAGVVSAIFGFLIGFPVLRLNDDYLAIASLGFSEIIRIVFINIVPITNGSLGLKGIPTHPSLLWTGGAAIVTIVFMKLLMKSSTGKALNAIREDEIAARAMGISLFRHKLLSFTISAFFAGVGGALMAGILGTIDPAQFKFALTFNIMLIVVLGGMGRIWGNVIAAIVVTYMMEYLRFLDEPMNNFLFRTNGLPGLRMVVFSLLLIVIVIFKKEDSGIDLRKYANKILRRRNNA